MVWQPTSPSARPGLRQIKTSLQGQSTVPKTGACGQNPTTYGTPFSTFVPSAATPVRLVSINGVPVPANSNGSFTVPDVTFNSTATVPVVVEAKTFRLELSSPSSYIQRTDRTVTFPALAGTLVLSSAQTNVTFPAGFSRVLCEPSGRSKGIVKPTRVAEYWRNTAQLLRLSMARQASVVVFSV